MLPLRHDTCGKVAVIAWEVCDRGHFGQQPNVAAFPREQGLVCCAPPGVEVPGADSHVHPKGVLMAARCLVQSRTVWLTCPAGAGSDELQKAYLPAGSGV